MSKYAWIIVLLALRGARGRRHDAVPDLRGTWKGESQSIVLGGTPHHPEQKTDQPRLTSVAFTLVIDKQDGRRFSGTFSSARHSETVIGDGSCRSLDAGRSRCRSDAVGDGQADPT